MSFVGSYLRSTAGIEIPAVDLKYDLNDEKKIQTLCKYDVKYGDSCYHVYKIAFYKSFR